MTDEQKPFHVDDLDDGWGMPTELVPRPQRKAAEPDQQQKREQVEVQVQALHAPAPPAAVVPSALELWEAPEKSNDSVDFGDVLSTPANLPAAARMHLESYLRPTGEAPQLRASTPSASSHLRKLLERGASVPADPRYRLAYTAIVASACVAALFVLRQPPHVTILPATTIASAQAVRSDPRSPSPVAALPSETEPREKPPQARPPASSEIRASGGTASERPPAPAPQPPPIRTDPHISNPTERVAATSTDEALGAFSVLEAQSALSAAASQAAACVPAGDPPASVRVAVAFAPSGRANNAWVEGLPYAGTPAGGCIAKMFREARVDPFEGPAVTVRRTFRIP